MDHNASKPIVEWISTSRTCRRARLSRYLRPFLDLPLPRYIHKKWVRYALSLGDIQERPRGVSLTLVDDVIRARLRLHPEHDDPQFRAAREFWERGVGDGYLWMEEGEPLCMIWLITSAHWWSVESLGTWAGMYPPLGPDLAVTEGLYTFRSGLRRRGGAATPMALELFHHARALGLRELRTHINTENTAARRWAARVGWKPIGTIHRCSLDLPRMRTHYLHLHELGLDEPPMVSARGRPL